MSWRALLAIGLASAGARADEGAVTWMPGNSREIARTASASRDVAASDFVFGPRVSAKGAMDLAFAAIRVGGLVLRPGIEGFLEIEYADTGSNGVPIPGQGKGPILWRGHYEFTLAVSAERLAHDWIGPRGALELTLTGGHESDHVTGGSFDDAPLPGDIVDGGGGNYLMLDAALRRPLGDDLDVWVRVEDRVYLAGPIRHAPGGEAGVIWHLAPHLEPVVSIFAEALLVDHAQNQANDGGFLGILAGPSVPGKLGTLLPYIAFDVGNGKGLLINRREAVVTVGARVAAF
jgi:hypothetical protein